MPEHSAPQPSAAARLDRVRALARLLDSAVGIPGTRWRIGLDGLIGLVPGFGDAAGALAAGYIVLQAARLGAPPVTLGRMLGNVLLEMLIGAVPLLGDLFDLGFKANLRNLRLLERHLAEPAPAARASRWWLAGVALALLAAVAAAGMLVAWLATWVLDAAR